MGYGITFDDKYHTCKDWGLKLLSFYMPLPAVKENCIDVPGMDGTLDLTDVFGRPLYSDRDGIEIVFDLLDGSYSKWFATCEKISAVLHGRKVKMTIDDESGRFYNVRLSVDCQKSNPIMSQITLSGKAEPYKYDTQSTSEPWLWDTFNFESGVIQQFDNVTVNGIKKVTLIGKGSGSEPIFNVSNSENLKLTYNGIYYDLVDGKNRFPDIFISKGDSVELSFSGTGSVSIDYRGKYI